MDERKTVPDLPLAPALSGIEDMLVWQDGKLVRIPGNTLLDLVRGVPPADLNTLQKIATAINNAANFHELVLRLAGGTMTGPIILPGDPASPLHAATKQYVDAVAARLFRCLSADATGANSSVAQPWFPANGAVTLTANKTYRFEGLLHLSRSAGTTSHTTSLLFGGTAAVSSIRLALVCNADDTATGVSPIFTFMPVTTEQVVRSLASTAATEQIIIQLRGALRITTGGTFIPQFKYSAAPGGAPVVKANSFFELFELGSDDVTAAGTWS